MEACSVLRMRLELRPLCMQAETSTSSPLPPLKRFLCALVIWLCVDHSKPNLHAGGDIDKIPYATKLLGRPPPIMKCQARSPTNLLLRYGDLGGLNLPIVTDNPFAQRLFNLVGSKLRTQVSLVCIWA